MDNSYSEMQRQIKVNENEDYIGRYVQRYVVLTTLKEQVQIPFQSSQPFPEEGSNQNGELDALPELELFSTESIKIQDYYIRYIKTVQSTRIRIQISDEPNNHSLLERITQLICDNKSISKVHIKFHYQMSKKDINLLKEILDKKELVELKLTLENNERVRDIFLLLKEKLKESLQLKSFSLEIMNYSIKSKDTQILSDAISQNKSLREIDIVSHFLIYDYESIIRAIGEQGQIEVVKLELTYSTDYVSDALIAIGAYIAKKLKCLKQIFISFNHCRLIEQESIILLLDNIYSNESIQTINLQFPFTTFDTENFKPFTKVGKREQPITLNIDFRIASDAALDYILQICRLNSFKSIEIKSAKNIHLRSGKLLSSQIAQDRFLEKLFFQGTYNDFLMIEEGLKGSQIITFSLTIKFSTIDYSKLKRIGNILHELPNLSNLNLVFYDSSYDVKHLTELIVQKLQQKPLMTLMRLTLFKFSSKQDQLIQFVDENINSRVILDIAPQNYTFQDPYLHLINLMAREQLTLISQIQFFHTNIAPLLHYNPIFIFQDLYLN